MKSRIGIVVGAALVFSLFSCENLDQVGMTSDNIVEDEILGLKTESAGDINTEPAMFAAGQRNGFGQGGQQNFLFSDCTTVTSSSDDFPKEITIEFNADCKGPQGESRSGQILISMSDSIIRKGAVCTITYVDVVFGDRQIELTKTMENKGQNADGHWMIETSMEQTVTRTDGSVSSRRHNGTREWISGFGTEETEDDVFLETGAGAVMTPQGDELNRQIVYPLLHDRSCGFIKSGVVELTGDDKEVSIDFGDGDCDQWATVTVDGVSREVDLSQKGGKGGFCDGLGQSEGSGKRAGKGNKGSV